MEHTLDVKKIFFSPPQSLSERWTLLITLLILFMIFFSPLRFSPVNPVEAVLTAMMPAVTLAWGWVVWLRFRFRKQDYLKA